MSGHTFAICIKNEDYEASLELRKLYEVLPDPKSEQLGMIRVVDESGEDYLYPLAFFVRISLPEMVEEQIFFSSSRSVCNPHLTRISESHYCANLSLKWLQS